MAPSPRAQPCLESQSLIPIKTKFEEIIVMERDYTSLLKSSCQDSNIREYKSTMEYFSKMIVKLEHSIAQQKY